MSAIVSDISLPVPPAQVWEELRHIERHVEWMSDAVRIDCRSAQREGVGTSFDCLTRIGPFTTTDVMTITEWRDGEVMGVEHRGLVSGRGAFTLLPHLGGTRLTWREDLRFPWWCGGAIGAWSARPVLRIIWRRNLRNFAQKFSAA
jgi:Polyketide cyclase / dehydrase and lipid transport